MSNFEWFLIGVVSMVDIPIIITVIWMRKQIKDLESTSHVEYRG